MAHTRVHRFSLLALSIVAIWIATSSAQETPSPSTAESLDMATSEKSRAAANSDTDHDGALDDATSLDTSVEETSTSSLDASGRSTTSTAHAGGYEVWVDFGAKGLETGSENRPFNTIAEGLADALTNGHDTLKISRYTPIFGTSETPTIDFPITLVSTNGPVLIGQGTKALYTYFTGIGGVVYEPTGMDETMLSYAVNPESRVFEENTIVTMKAYAADGWRFDGWWYPTDFVQKASLDDFLPAATHAFLMDRDRYVWPIFIKNTTDEDVADPDDDGLANYRETEFGTDPNDEDSDSDGLPDWWEVNYRLDPLNSVGADGAQGDPDQDSITNEDEFVLGTDPHIDELEEEARSVKK